MQQKSCMRYPAEKNGLFLFIFHCSMLSTFFSKRESDAGGEQVSEFSCRADASDPLREMQNLLQIRWRCFEPFNPNGQNQQAFLLCRCLKQTALQPKNFLPIAF